MAVDDLAIRAFRHEVVAPEDREAIRDGRERRRRVLKPAMARRHRRSSPEHFPAPVLAGPVQVLVEGSGDEAAQGSPLNTPRS